MRRGLLRPKSAILPTFSDLSQRSPKHPSPLKQRGTRIGLCKPTPFNFLHFWRLSIVASIETRIRWTVSLLQRLRQRRSGATSEQTPGDEADLASEDAEVSLETRLMDRDAKLLREVERALEKVQDGHYGLCEGTDEPIGYARLKLRPWTRYSVTYKEELEREEKRMGGAE